MGMSGGGGSKAVPYINVTPMIDVLLVLLIIFMVLTPLKPTRFKTLVPEKSDELNEAAKQSPRTLSVTVGKDLKVALTRGVDKIAEASVNDPSPIAARLAQEFRERRDNSDWKPGMESRAELSADERIEKTVFIKAPQTFKYGDVVKVIDSVKGAGASPVGLQTELLDP